MLNHRISRTDLQDAFILVAERKGVRPLVIEKDFWITWCLKKLFSLSFPVGMVFKGGTSLSKAYNLIHRLSEDCDITLNRANLGFEGDKDPLRASSRKKRDKLLDELKQACGDFIGSTLKMALQESLRQELEGEKWELRQEADPQLLRFYYPQTLATKHYGDQNYIRRSILLEFGVRGDIYPTEEISFKSFVTEELDAFEENSILIPCLSPLRTFWEKATLLHAEYYRPLEKATPERLSRHYYDISMLLKAGIAEKAMQQKELLTDVIENKRLLFPSAWANYPLIKSHGIKLLPPPERLPDLRNDYEQTREMMIYGSDKPSFENLLDDMQMLEKQLQLM